MCGDDSKKIINRIVTKDETWIHHYGPESKQESMQWYQVESSTPNKFKVSVSAEMVMTTAVWDVERILMVDYKKRIQKLRDHFMLTIQNDHTKNKRNLDKGCAMWVKMFSGKMCVIISSKTIILHLMQRFFTYRSRPKVESPYFLKGSQNFFARYSL